MKAPIGYIAFCLLVVAGFAYAKAEGLTLFASRGVMSGRVSDGGYRHHTGISGGYHK